MTAPVVWKSSFILTSGSEGVQMDPAVQALADGSFVALWQTPSGAISLRLFNADGTAKTGDIPITLATGDATKFEPTITLLSNGNFVVAWDDDSGLDGDAATGIRGQIFNADGVKVGTDFHINSTVTGHQSMAGISALANGGFAVSFTDYAGDTDGSPAIRTRIFDQAGQALGSDRIVNGVATGPQENSSIITLNDGRYVVFYEDGSPRTDDPSTPTIRGRVILANGEPDTSVAEFLVPDEGASGQQRFPAGVKLADGGFVVAWIEENGAIKAQLFNADATKSGTAFLLSENPANTIPSLVALKDGGFAISFSDADVIHMMAFNAAGNVSGSMTFNAPEGWFVEMNTDLSVLADGRIVVSWDERLDSITENDRNVRAAIIDPRDHAVTLPGSDANDWHYGTGFDDVLNGLKGADRLFGAAGKDILNGGEGTDILDGGADDDIYYVDDAGDAVVESTAGGTDVVYTKANYVLGENVENIMALSGEYGAVYLTGNALANTIIGNEADNVINGGAGADVMQGGLGNDTYYVDNAGDAISDNSGSDTVCTSINYTLGDHVENLAALSGQAAAIFLTGNAFANRILGNEADNWIDGRTGADAMEGGSGNDTYIVDDAGDVVSDSSGTDTVYASISYTLASSAEILRASGSAAISLTGNAFANTIYGNAGANKVNGGLGKDTLYGGAGKDAFVFNTKLDKKYNVDKIMDYKVSDDTIHLENKVMTKLKAGKLASGAFWKGAKAHDKDDRIIYDSKTGYLYYDADGTGSKYKQVLIATLSKNLKMAASEFTII